MRKTIEVAALAEKLAKSEARREATIALAHLDHEDTRKHVIAVGTERAKQLRKLEAETAAEAAKAEALVKRA